MWRPRASEPEERVLPALLKELKLPDSDAKGPGGPAGLRRRCCQAGLLSSPMQRLETVRLTASKRSCCCPPQLPG